MKTGTTFNHGQLAQLANNVNIAVATALPKVAVNFEPKSLLKAMEGRGQFLADKLGPALEQILKGLFVLGTPGTATITLTKQHNPTEFYQTREGLYVWPDFKSRVVANSDLVEAGTVFKLNHALLTENMLDAEIEAVLLAKHLFDETQACAIIAGFIEEQPNGEEGVLLNSGHANPFYLGSCVVGVRWSADDRKWYVSTWRRDGGRWSAGDRVFSPATDA